MREYVKSQFKTENLEQQNKSLSFKTQTTYQSEIKIYQFLSI